MQIEIVSGDEGWPLVESLEREVYPPEIMATAPWRNVVWSHADTRVLVRLDGRIVSHVGMYRREGTADGVSVRIGGIGGVMTSAAHRRSGCASAAMKSATHQLFEDRVDFCLLFCEQHNVKFYEGLGWSTFEGETYFEQPSGRMRLDIFGAMVLGRNNARQAHAIDLCGLPW